MKKKILILALALVLIIPVMLFATACGGSKTEAKITLATTDKSKISHDYAGWSFPVNNSITSVPVYGYNIYDYSELKVLVNGEVVNDNSIFQPNDFSINSYDGSRVRIGTLYFGTFKENTTISFDESSIKDIEIKIGFIHNSDSRLDWIFDTTGPYTEKGSDTNLSTFKSNYKVKINNSDLEKLEEQQHITITPDQYGLVSAEYLFSNDTDYQITDSSKENKYSPYMFTYNVSDFFEFDSSAYHAKPMFLYSENGFGYYNFNDENYFQSNATCGENYEFEVGSLIESTQEQYYDYTIGDHSRSTIQIDDDEIVYFKDMADKGVDVKNMSNMSFDFYDNNLIILSTDNMKIRNFDAGVENYAGSIMTELDGSNGNIYPIGNVNTNRTFYVTTLNDEDVSGFDFSETVVSINDTIIPEITSKTNDDIAWYELKNTNGKEYFEITIAKDILPIDFYTNEDFETFESYPLNTTKYQIKVDNIKVGDELTGVAKLTVTTNKEKGDTEYLVIDRIWPSDSTNIYMDLDSNIQKNLYYKISGDYYNDSPVLYFETSQMFVKYNTMKFKITSGSEEYNINLQEIQQGDWVYDEDVLNNVNKYTINEANIDLMFLQDQGVYIRFNNISKDYKVDLIFN